MKGPHKYHRPLETSSVFCQSGNKSQKLVWKSLWSGQQSQTPSEILLFSCSGEERIMIPLWEIFLLPYFKSAVPLCHYPNPPFPSCFKLSHPTKPWKEKKKDNKEMNRFTCIHLFLTPPLRCKQSLCMHHFRKIMEIIGQMSGKGSFKVLTWYFLA